MNFSNSKLSIIRLFSIAFLISMLIGCGSDEESESSKSMQQIQTEEGIPVRIQEIKYEPFQRYLSFYSKLRGIKESTIGAAIRGRIEKVFADVRKWVKEDDVIIQFPLDSPNSMYEQMKSAFENSKKNYERGKALIEVGEIAQSVFDGFETQYLIDKSNYETQRQMLFIDAPYDGIITDMKVKEGDNVKSKDPLFSIAQLHKMITKVWITEEEINQIKKGMTAVVEFNGKEYTGKVSVVSLKADPKNQAFYTELEFKNPNNELKSGVTVNIKILTYDNPESIIIPRNLVRKDEKGQYVYIEKKSVASKRYISNGEESGLNYEVKNGLIPGDRLIIKGASQLEDNIKVKVIQ
ncbi:efflux RND transporter periplasmic adaptor subunit [Bacteroidota bacterium]